LHNGIVATEIPSGMCAKLCSWQEATIKIMRRNLSYYWLLALHI